ncbi:RidA family protein [Solicola gregarius]|uniref:RidA family protein n=1 Tax=Solicola gregarius TaxID=2908642 RepID=A0AA46TEZ7_9ACTN|nr:hypothetical protein [Solicola gregarius]UYM04132.1 hypothetical protein L0C25_16495 [Solicola gregarius]
MAYAVESANDRLIALGHSLPPLSADPKHAAYRTADSAIYVSGQLPYCDGGLMDDGVLGLDLDVDVARPLAVQARSAIGVAALPRNSPAEIRLVCGRA